MPREILILSGFCLFFLLIFYLIGRFSKEKLKWELLISSFVIVFGLYIGHYLETSRDLENKRREQRVEMLVKAFQNLTKIYNHDILEVKEDMQSALIDVQLLGSPAQAERIELYVKNVMKEKRQVWDDFDNIVDDLRNDLREELGLPEIKGKVWWIRIEKAQEATNQSSQPMPPGK